jgi:hypothetical protein
MRDSTRPLLSAIAALPRENALLVFPPGKYKIDAPEGPVLRFDAFQALAVEGNEATLLCRGLANPILFSNCRDTSLRNINVDWQSPSFVEGHVRSASDTAVLIDLAPLATGQMVREVQAITEYDPARRLPVPRGVDSYGSVSAVEQSGDSLKLTLTRPLPLRAGMYLVLRQTAYGSNVLALRNCERTKVERVSVYASPGMGVVALGCTDTSFDQLRVTPPEGSQRCLSTNSDGLHAIDCRGEMSVSRSVFRGMGDDAINVFSSFWEVQTADRNSLLLAGRRNSPIGSWQLPQPGDILQIFDRKTLALVTRITVTRAELTGPLARVTFSESCDNLLQGALACNVQAGARLHISGSRFLGNRARGVLAHQNVTVAGNRFVGCSMAAILLAPDTRWMEGPPAGNVIIRENHFAGCGYGPASHELGVITIATNHDCRSDPLQAPQINRDITVRDNVFAPSSVPAIYCQRAARITIEHNRFLGD